ncbi:citrate/2-methylcitrate synthase [Clostridium sp. MB40-C1]|uniref:citrate/2-methylcitrate synthase n=1 Tax=Clostridium sp. MB40-C1 TaxID=3070996 RepID=UPI0027DFFA8F|nr:citrate/2-methylcitrate synthase [Clostridium sp. MB40-C1]WMJ79155.1 citrate/2-methylcitrate synthase [Clostridium sp. MB40-C1]
MLSNSRGDLFEKNAVYKDSLNKLTEKAKRNNIISSECYKRYDVKRGLRNENGTGVLVGLTEVGNVHGYTIENRKKIPDEGMLTYRGIDVREIVNGFQKDKRFGFEEVCYLLLLGEFPSEEELKEFKIMLGECRELPDGFTEDMILKFPSNNIMNKLERSILVAYSFDDNPDDTSIKNILRQSIELISRVPVMIAYGYQAKAHYYDGKSLFIHSPKAELGVAENILHLIRPDNQYTKTEAEVLDLSLVLHAEHGGGNNSAFATHVVSSTGTDTYSAIAAAVGSLKGPKHGGANIKVINMMSNIKENINDWQDVEEIKKYLIRILKKEVFDKAGLIYGIGHAIYTLSDPRAVMLKEKALELAKEKGRVDEFLLYENVEKTALKIFKELRGREDICVNVDFYSGFVYDMLNIPCELYTPLFAAARMAGWCAHRIEQVASEPKIIRPAYKNVKEKCQYIPIRERN